MLLFLHGFLGQKEDWDPLISYLSSPFPIRCIDLPGHGKAPITKDIALYVKEQISSAKIVIGYSAGGRLALELKQRFPKSYERIIVISSHPGLKNEKEKQERRKLDQQWIKMLNETPFNHFLEKWYSQPLFQHLKNSSNFEAMFQRRKEQNPQKMAWFLQNFSVANQLLCDLLHQAIFVHGIHDLKYAKLYRTLSGIEKIFTIDNSGHAVHLENPKACAKVIQGAINEYY